MELVYLASPYSHKDPKVREERFVAACKAAAWLMKQGYAVFSPIAHSHSIAIHGDIDGLDCDFWLKQDMEMLKFCEKMVILTIDGWDTSKGVGVEMGYMRYRDERILSLTEVDGSYQGVNPAGVF